MKNNSLLDKKVDDALHSIDNIQPAVAPAFFYAKVLAKIKIRVSVWEKWSAYFLRPAIAFTVICFIVIINAVVVYSKTDNHFSQADQTGLASSDEYNDGVTGLYDLENVKP